MNNMMMNNMMMNNNGNQMNMNMMNMGNGNMMNMNMMNMNNMGGGVNMMNMNMPGMNTMMMNNMNNMPGMNTMMMNMNMPGANPMMMNMNMNMPGANPTMPGTNTNTVVNIEDANGWNLIFENQNDRQTFNIRISEQKLVKEAISYYYLKSNKTEKCKFIFNNNKYVTSSRTLNKSKKVIKSNYLLKSYNNKYMKLFKSTQYKNNKILFTNKIDKTNLKKSSSMNELKLNTIKDGINKQSLENIRLLKEIDVIRRDRQIQKKKL